MDAQLKRGVIDAAVLALLTKGDSYGYQIISDLEEVIELSESTLYPVLRRLESNNFLVTYDQDYRGRKRKYYTITDKGRYKVKIFLEDLKDLVKVCDFIRGIGK